MPQQVFKRPETLSDKPTHFCPGCTHGTAHRLTAEAIDHFGLREKTIGVACVGCAVFMYDYFNVDVIEAPHGRAPAVATGVKRAKPDKGPSRATVFTLKTPKYTITVRGLNGHHTATVTGQDGKVLCYGKR